MLEDFGSINGMFLRVQGTAQLGEKATIRVGRQILSFEILTPPPARQQTVKRLGSPDPGYWGRIGVMLDHKRCAAVVAVRDATATVGQAATCELSFADDDRLSNVHCTLSRTDVGASISDGGSDGGVWVRMASGTTIPYGAELLIGDTRVCVERT